MHDQTDITAVPPVTMQSKPQVSDHSVCSTIGNQIDGLLNIDQPGDGAERHTVVERHDDGPAGVSIHNTFQTNLFTSHNHSPPGI
jgi:hypothetical protein